MLLQKNVVPLRYIRRVIPRRIMVFACQADSFCKEYKTRVVTCTEAKLDGKPGYEVVLQDTILFPEGGGQVGLLLQFFQFYWP